MNHQQNKNEVYVQPEIDPYVPEDERPTADYLSGPIDGNYDVFPIQGAASDGKVMLKEGESANSNQDTPSDIDPMQGAPKHSSEIRYTAVQEVAMRAILNRAFVEEQAQERK